LFGPKVGYVRRSKLGEFPKNQNRLGMLGEERACPIFSGQNRLGKFSRNFIIGYLAYRPIVGHIFVNNGQVLKTIHKLWHWISKYIKLA
jgi:hypothetical protein